MKTIGLVDFYISEWHANNYPKWIKELCEQEGKDFCVKYAWAEEYVSPVDGRNTDEWCEAFGVTKCDTIDELCEKSDYIIVLAPSDPEKHLGYAKEVLKYKKNTYIDKTFAPDYATAKEIFNVAEGYGTKFFSTSALRYAEELDGMLGADYVITTGGGGNLDEYIIHQVEMVTKVIDREPLEVKVENQGTQYISRVKFEDNKEATMIYAPCYGFAICAEKAGEKPQNKPASAGYFQTLIAEILKFFETGVVPFDENQTLKVMKIREAVIEAKSDLGNWRKV